MGNKAALVVLVLVLFYGLAMAVSFVEDGDWRREREESEETGRSREKEESREREEREKYTEGRFLLQESKRVVKTDAGEMRVVRSFDGRVVDRRMHIGFITMDPKTLFIPQYLDSSLIIFIRKGEAKIGLIYKDELGERWLKSGDVYHIPAGSAFYLVNTAEGQNLHIICSIDPSESLGMGAFQSFFIGGGTYPTSVLAGFDPKTLSRAFNVSSSKVREILTRQNQGPIIFLNDSRSSSPWKKFLQLKEHERLQHLKKLVNFHEEPVQEEKQTWSWRKLLNNILGTETENKAGEKGKGKTPDSYNLYNRNPDFKNNYGWSVALDETDYKPLKHSGIGLYLVNLTAGSMMAPHVNPTATEYGIVLKGSGTIQIVFPNGTSAMIANITEGDVFWVPRYFPFCQIASKTGPLEFFGFTTSAHENRPQFLVGANSLLKAMMGPELAAGLGIPEDELRSLFGHQEFDVILPPETKTKRGEEEPPDTKTKRGEEEFGRKTKVIKSFGNDMAMGFD